MDVIRAVTGSLSKRLIILMTLAMLPLGAISIYQTYAVLSDAREINSAALLFQTVSAANHEREMIQEALGAARGLGSIAPTLPEAACSELMRRFVDGHEQAVFAGFIRLDGQMRCASSGEPVSFAGSPILESALADPGPIVAVNTRGAVTGQSVVLASQPAIVKGELRGFVSVSIPHDLANSKLDPNGVDPGFRLASVNADGSLVSATGGLEAAADFLPREMNHDQLFAESNQTFQATAGEGTRRQYAVAPMVEGRLMLIGSWPVSQAIGFGGATRAQVALLFPVLMWIAGMGVAYFGLQRLVVRHVRQLRSAMRRLALGERDAGGLELDDPPEELADAQRAFNRMALILSEAEARQERDLQDKEVLLKEVHHRVKNNLQLIASIMNMQMRNARNTETRWMLAGLQRRVRGLAMLHQTLYTKSEITTVDSGELVRTVAKDVSQLSPESRPVVHSELDSVPLYPDQAVPLSMLLAEALTNAVKYAGVPKGENHPRIDLTLTAQDDGTIVMRVANSKPAGASTILEDEDSTGLGARLMQAFATQLDGKIDIADSPGEYVLSVSFQRREFVPADDAGTSD